MMLYFLISFKQVDQIKSYWNFSFLREHFLFYIDLFPTTAPIISPSAAISKQFWQH